MALFLVLYSVLLAAGKVMKRQNVVGWIVVALTAIEVVQFDRITVANRNTVSKQDLKERIGYNDETVDAVRDIKAGDTSFFRVTKPRPSAPTVWTSLNDAMIFGYYGTSSYSSFNNGNYTAFLTAIDAIPPTSEYKTRWSIGLLDSAIWSTFACEKYALDSDPVFYQSTLRYEMVRRYGKNYLFRNELFLPLGLHLSRYMPEDAFRKLSIDEKPQAMMRAVVLSKENEAKIGGLPQLTVSELQEELRATSLGEVVANCRDTALKMTSFQQTRIEGTVRGEAKGVLVFQTPFDRGWHALQDGQPVRVLKVDIGLLGVVVDAGEHKVELSYHTPFLGYALTVTLLSGLILAVGVWRWPRIQLPA